MNNPVSFCSKLLKTDVTALKFLCNDLLLAGVGHSVCLYKTSTLKLLSKIDVFVGQKIHGFAPSKDGNEIIIYGGKRATVCQLMKISESYKFNLLKKSLRSSSWITCLLWVSDSRIAILTAHNSLQIWDYSTMETISSHTSEEKCFLYSGLILNVQNEVLVFAGTVFSQVVVWDTESEKVHHRLMGHKGVIFSISFSESIHKIVTTSDDRSIRTWSVCKENYSNTLNFWRNIQIEPHLVLYGHTARVFKGIISDNLLFSIGEDAFLCTWNIDKEENNLLMKKRVHQDGCVWSLDYDNVNKIVVTGGSDSGVTLHRNFKESSLSKERHLLPHDFTVAKKLVMTARGNIVCITEQGALLYYDFEMQEWYLKHQFDWVSSYFKLAVSLCKQFLAVADINGHIHVFLENCKFDPNIKHLFSQKINDGIIHSLHWVDNRSVVICGDEGSISVWGPRGDSCEQIQIHELPACKERWLTAAAMDTKNHVLLIGDRCGNIHLYKKYRKNPIQSISRVHGRLGINCIELFKDNIITTGRNGCVKYFKLSTNFESGNDCCNLQYLHNVKVPFEWVERFIDKDKQMVCGFKETRFVIFNLKSNCVLLEVDCGGGHRSWDVTKKWLDFENKTNKVIRYIYINKSDVYSVTVKVDNIILQNIVEGYHTKEINDVKSIECSFDGRKSYILVSGGEDTIIRFNHFDTLHSDNELLEKMRISSHLSSIRSILLLPLIDCSEFHKKYLLFTAGGRAQICINQILILNTENVPHISYRELCNYMLKGTDLERKKNSGWARIEKDMEAETRIMSLNSIQTPQDTTENNKILVAGCSDGYLRVYRFLYSEFESTELTLLKCFEFHKKCILNVHSFHYKKYSIVITFCIDGSTAFWNFTSYVETKSSYSKYDDLEPFFSLKIHKAGINSYDVMFISCDKFLLATGGDDNAIQLNVLSLYCDELDGRLHARRVSNFCCTEYHGAQVTGLRLCDNQTMISSSIDQRITISKLRWNENNYGDLECKYLGQYHTSVSDLQGICAMAIKGDEISLNVYGKGIQCLTIKLEKDKREN